MGAWDTGIFDNDTACDWACGLKDAHDRALIERTLDAVLDVGDDYLEAPEAEEALAAAETLARLLGRGGVRNAYTEAVDAWVAAHPGRPSPELLDKARRAVARILGADSELRELWEDSDDADAWRQAVEDLQARLRAD